MTCGSKKHIEEALAKIQVKDIDEDQKQSTNPKRKGDRMLQEAQ